MPEKPRPLQQDMFTGELVDNRTRTQKKRDKVHAQPHQKLLFSQREIAQFGVNPHPQFPLSPHTLLRLIREDPRTPEQKAHDLQRASEKQTKPLLDEDANDATA